MGAPSDTAERSAPNQTERVEQRSAGRGQHGHFVVRHQLVKEALHQTAGLCQANGV